MAAPKTGAVRLSLRGDMRVLSLCVGLAATVAVALTACSNPEQSKTLPPPPRPAKQSAQSTTPADAPPDPAAQKLYESACTSCHGLDQIKDYDGAEPWDKIVERMVARHGAKLNSDMRAQVAAYLNAALPPKKS
jgi:hypothetical protein